MEAYNITNSIVDQGFRDPIEDGYDPRLEGFSSRAKDMVIQDAKTIRLTRISDVEVASARLHEAARNGKVNLPNDDDVLLDVNLFGLMVEAHDHGPHPQYYGNIHNDGHYLVASVSDSNGEFNRPLGPMAIPSTAAKDPIFYRQVFQ